MLLQSRQHVLRGGLLGTATAAAHGFCPKVIILQTALYGELLGMVGAAFVQHLIFGQRPALGLQTLLKTRLGVFQQLGVRESFDHRIEEIGDDPLAPALGDLEREEAGR